MAIQNDATRNYLAQQYAARATHAAVYSSVPGATAGTEIATVARVPVTWGAPAVVGGQSVITGTAEVTGIPAGSTVRGAGLHTALSGGSYVDGAAVAEQAYATGGGKYALTVTYTQS